MGDGMRVLKNHFGLLAIRHRQSVWSFCTRWQVWRTTIIKCISCQSPVAFIFIARAGWITDRQTDRPGGSQRAEDAGLADTQN